MLKLTRLTHLTQSGDSRHLNLGVMTLYGVLREEQENIVVFSALTVFACLHKVYGNYGRLCNQGVKMKKVSEGEPANRHRQDLKPLTGFITRI